MDQFPSDRNQEVKKAEKMTWRHYLFVLVCSTVLSLIVVGIWGLGKFLDFAVSRPDPKETQTLIIGFWLLGIPILWHVGDFLSDFLQDLWDFCYKDQENQEGQEGKPLTK